LREHRESLGGGFRKLGRPVKTQGKDAGKNTPQFDRRTEICRITTTGQLIRIDVLTTRTSNTEAGADLSSFPSEKRFTS
jgi:hypothetical protein